MARHEASIARLSVGAYTVPTATPESDGTLEWHATTLVLVEVTAADVTGVGFSYADMATARLVHDLLRDVVVGRTPLAVADCWGAMVRAIRNLGRPGIASMAIAAVDNALWDLKARLLDVSLVTLLGAARLAVPVYGSGGFTSYSVAELEAQLKGWTASGIAMVKMKVGREPAADVERVRAARKRDRRRGALRRRERRVQPQAGAAACRALRRGWCELVRGTGVEGRSGRPAPLA